MSINSNQQSDKRIPNFGKNIDPRNDLAKKIIIWMFVGVAGLILLDIISGFLSVNNDVNIDKSNTENVNENYSDVITAYQISSDYESNEVAADLKYRDQIFRISGVVEEISRSFTERMVVSLEGYNYREIHCDFSEEHINIISKLYKGQSIIIEGKCTGKMIGSVILEDCVIK
jgi:hypothetical protein